MNQDIFFVEEETINNKTIYIIQGLGDNISYVRAIQLCKGKDAQQCWDDYGYCFALDENNSYSLYIKESAGLNKVLHHCGLEFTDITQEEVALSNSKVVL